jgi:small subunit ribosomal protein S1
LEPGIDGLIHISKLGGGKRIAHPKEAVREGEKLEVKIESIDLASRKISLTLATVSRAAEEAAQSVDEFRQLAAKTEKTSFGSFGDLLKKTDKSK